MLMPLHGLSFEMTKLSSCDGSWNFKPRQRTSALLPAWALDGHLLTGFDMGSEHPVQNIQVTSSTDASALLKALYPELTWPEIVRLLDQPDTEKYFYPDALMAAYGLGWDEHWQRVSELLVTWPDEIQNYISEKALRPFDLMVLMSLPLQSQIPILQKLVRLNLSKSLFCQALELAGESLLLSSSLEDILEKLNHSDFLEELKKDRFPVAYFADQGFKEKVEKAAWPKGVHAQTQRRGDTLGVEFKIFAKNRDELSKILKNIETTYEQLDSTLR
jgi:hypothetical protein